MSDVSGNQRAKERDEVKVNYAYQFVICFSRNQKYLERILKPYE